MDTFYKIPQSEQRDPRKLRLSAQTALSLPVANITGSKMMETSQVLIS